MLRKILLFIMYTSLSITIKAGGVDTVSIDFELSETAINRAIVSQFNDPNFIFQHFTGEFEFAPGYIVPYDVQLERPTVEIGDEWLGIHLAFQIHLPSLELEYKLDITPLITVEDQNIMAGKVVAKIQNLEETIDSWTDIPESVRNLLESLYNTYEPQVYASNLYNDVLEELNADSFFKQRALSITDFGLSTSFEHGKFVLKVLVELTFGNTKFYCYVNPDDNQLRFGSNIQCNIKSVIFWVFDEEVYRNENLNIELMENPDVSFDYYAEINDIKNFANSPPFIVYVLMETETTFYYNKFVLLGANYWEDSPALKINY